VTVIAEAIFTSLPNIRVDKASHVRVGDVAANSVAAEAVRRRRYSFTSGSFDSLESTATMHVRPVVVAIPAHSCGRNKVE
jgi:hypothetical protein